jgi:hypothetical protein
MPFVPKVPLSCADFNMDRVSQVLAKHRAYFPTAARELGVPPADLKRLMWAKPHVLDEAHEAMDLVVIRANAELIKALFSDDPRRQMWASDRILSSWVARDSPLAPAGRSTRSETRARAPIVTRFEEKPSETVIERDGKSIPVPRYDDGRGDDCLKGEAAPPLPVWPGPCLPPPLVANLYAPYSPPPRPMIVGGHREAPRPAVLRRRRRA